MPTGSTKGCFILILQQPVNCLTEVWEV